MTLAHNAFNTPLALTAFVVLLSVAGSLVLWYEDPAHAWWRGWVQRCGRRMTGRLDLAWIDVRLLTALAAASFAASALVTWALGEYGCTSGGPSDLLTLVTSGRAFLSGGNPFTITACGHAGNPVPAGLASVVLDAIGSLGEEAGVLLVWGAVSVGLVPLLWYLAGKERAVVTTFVLVSFLYLPIVAVQVDGATLALVPVAVLLVVHLSRRGWVKAAALGGFLATGRFPALFPILATSGRAGSRRTATFAAALGTFGAITLATVAVYGSQFTGPVFWLQFGRSHFALNYWGLLEGKGWLGPSTTLTVVQAVVTVVLVGVCWVWARSELGAAAIVLTGTILLTQYLSFTALVFLVPVALLGSRARWWLWAIGVVASTNYLLVLRSVGSGGGPFGLSYALDLLLTVLLLGLLVDLLRKELIVTTPRAARSQRPATGPVTARAPAAEGPAGVER